jgi:hypothetical protein
MWDIDMRYVIPDMGFEIRDARFGMQDKIFCKDDSRIAFTDVNEWGSGARDIFINNKHKVSRIEKRVTSSEKPVTRKVDT